MSAPSTPPPAASPTQLLRSWRGGDSGAMDRLWPLVYEELARIAHSAMSSERPSHTLETRALVHEAYLRLIDASVDWKDRAHFMALAARTMRRILIDHAKGRNRDKRGGKSVHVTLDFAPGLEAPGVDILALHEALERLAAQDQRKASIVELHYFGGVSQEEAAEALGLSLTTVERELRLARAWLRRELDGSAAP
jgi:RNA polymerase sigma factor (TIGR02999 family)